MMLKAYRKQNGMPVEPNEVITDFRGKNWIYLAPIRASTRFYSGKVQVKDEDGNVREFYDNVFKLVVENIDDPTTEGLGNGTFAA